jgi:hypothetical protein
VGIPQLVLKGDRGVQSVHCGAIHTSHCFSTLLQLEGVLLPNGGSHTSGCSKDQLLLLVRSGGASCVILG